jgi:hypothetical protein
MGGMAHDNLVFAVAASYVRRLGPKATETLEEQAEIAEGINDTDSAAIWREIVAIADDMLRPRQLAS